MEKPRRRKPKPARPTGSAASASPARNFTLTTEEQVRAITIGAPAWSVRKRRIEDAIEGYVDGLLDLRDSLLARGASEAETLPKLVAHARGLDLAKVDRLIAQHNRYFPMEANLAMSPSGGYLLHGEPWEPEPPLTLERLLDLVEASLEPVSLDPARSERSPRSGIDVGPASGRPPRSRLG